MTEDLINELAREVRLLVVARASAFTYKVTVRPEQVSRELGVRYARGQCAPGEQPDPDHSTAMTATVITCGLRLDRDLNDIFAVQADIARMITRSLAVQLTAAEEKHMGSPYTTVAGAWTYYQQGLKLYRNFTSTDNALARTRFEEAIRLDPNFAKAYALLAATHRQDWILGWNRDLKTRSGKLRTTRKRRFGGRAASLLRSLRCLTLSYNWVLSTCTGESFRRPRTRQRRRSPVVPAPRMAMLWRRTY
jgi:adenylate cyclase